MKILSPNSLARNFSYGFYQFFENEKKPNERKKPSNQTHTINAKRTDMLGAYV